MEKSPYSFCEHFSFNRQIATKRRLWFNIPNSPVGLQHSGKHCRSLRAIYQKDKQNFYIIARGSAFETINHILYAEKVGYIKENKSNEILSTANNLIHDLNKILKSLN